MQELPMSGEDTEDKLKFAENFLKMRINGDVELIVSPPSRKGDEWCARVWIDGESFTSVNLSCLCKRDILRKIPERHFKKKQNAVKITDPLTKGMNKFQRAEIDNNFENYNLTNKFSKRSARA